MLVLNYTFSVLCDHGEVIESEGEGSYGAPGDEQDFPQPNFLPTADTGLLPFHCFSLLITFVPVFNGEPFSW